MQWRMHVQIAKYIEERQLSLPLPVQRHAVFPGEGSDMHQTVNGTSVRELPPLRWQKSRRSNPSGNCVEMARLPEGSIAVRNSRHPDGPALVYTVDEIAAFLLGARDGDFDNLVG